MVIQLHSDMKLSEIQHVFHQQFPYLKVLFFAKPHVKGESSSHADLLDSTLTLTEIGVSPKMRSIGMEPDLTVAQLESAFLTACGLNAQIFRRSGDAWIQTSVTDTWTLAEQNQTGKADSKQIAPENAPIDGFREQD